jgi:SAM-dependent methyltransferase
MTTSGEPWALALFRRSILKQAKFREIERLLGDVDRACCLDLGGDNGVISYLLRQRGGTWTSADIGTRNVESIRALVGERVALLDGSQLPFDDASFDTVVVADLLEHVADDRRFALELARIVRPGGSLIVNVPHVKPRSILNRIRHAIGLGDEWHGHLRPGYSAQGLDALLSPAFRIESVRTYSRAFSEGIDLALNGAYEKLRPSRNGRAASAKGVVITGDDVQAHRRQFALLSVVYPFLRAISALDVVLPMQEGYKLIVRATRVPGPAR